MEKLSHELGRHAGENSEGALRVLMGHDWPGNVRELENAEVWESARPMAITASTTTNIDKRCSGYPDAVLSLA